MTKRIQIYLLIVSVFVLSTSCVSICNDIYNNSLEYGNDIRLEVSFPEPVLTLDEGMFKALIANVDTGTILYEHMMKSVPKELSDALFLGWYKHVWERDFEPYINDEYPYDSTYRVFEYYLNERKTWETFCCIGKVFLSEKYDSYLVASKESDEKLQKREEFIKEYPELATLPNSIYKRIYIVNVKDSLMASMAMLWWAWDYDINPRFTYTTVKDKVFRQRECNIFSESYPGFRLFNPDTWLRDPTRGVRFKFDDEGKVVVLSRHRHEQ